MVSTPSGARLHRVPTFFGKSIKRLQCGYYHKSLKLTLKKTEANPIISSLLFLIIRVANAMFSNSIKIDTRCNRAQEKYVKPI